MICEAPAFVFALGIEYSKSALRSNIRQSFVINPEIASLFRGVTECARRIALLSQSAAES